jgi:hypothetical protein
MVRKLNEYGAAGGMRIDKGNRSTRIKYAPMPIFFTLNLMLLHLESNADRQGWEPTTSRIFSWANTRQRILGLKEDDLLSNLTPKCPMIHLSIILRPVFYLAVSQEFSHTKKKLWTFRIPLSSVLDTRPAHSVILGDLRKQWSSLLYKPKVPVFFLSPEFVLSAL